MARICSADVESPESSKLVKLGTTVLAVRHGDKMHEGLNDSLRARRAGAL